MKILVDKMPTNPSECPYSYGRYNKNWCYYRKNDVSTCCEDTKKCKWFTDKIEKMLNSEM